mmetsp:Transcript_7573/g.21082  ORF Transcript_7573/g.21082 Transcript_7573/m.21082 type:complete len:469 (-) Transcript_7573:306-1712(-)
MERMNDQAKADQAQSLSDDEESERIRKMMEEDVVGRDKEKAGGEIEVERIMARSRTSMADTHASLDPSAYSCSICLELLHKPAVNTCGHVFCYWCMHRAMDLLDETHNCPLCREKFSHLPAVCWPLQEYLTVTFPDEMETREEEVARLEREEFHAESPKAPATRKTEDKSDLVGVLLEIFQCVECGKVPAPPTVLTCGHIVCCGTEDTVLRQKKTCPVHGCIGKMAAVDRPAVCSLIDTILQKYMTEEIKSVTASSCCGGIFLEASSAAADMDISYKESRSFAPGDLVVIEGLQSERGSKYNGRKAKIESFDDATSRYTCTLLGTSQTISIKSENLKKAEEEEKRYVHYGVGCDGCGAFPIVGQRWKCGDCSEEIGFDLCGDCYNDGVHNREGQVAAGRFNQQHRPNHEMLLMEQVNTFFHQLQRAHPNVPLSQLISMMEMEQSGANESDEEDEETVEEVDEEDEATS